jgi:hypothetical protein
LSMVVVLCFLCGFFVSLLSFYEDSMCSTWQMNFHYCKAWVQASSWVLLYGSPPRWAATVRYWEGMIIL